MKIDKNYLGFRKWYNSNKGDAEAEKIAWAAWIAAMEFISDNYEIKDRKIGQDKYYLE